MRWQISPVRARSCLGRRAVDEMLLILTHVFLAALFVKPSVCSIPLPFSDPIRAGY